VPAGLLLTAGAERIGLDHAYSFAYFNLGWAGGFTVGAGAGGALAEATTDAVPYLVVAALYAITVAAGGALGARAPQRAAARPGGDVGD
jgi:hypothetical protein